jgi:hypothetical protein
MTFGSNPIGGHCGTLLHFDAKVAKRVATNAGKASSWK